MKEIPKYKLYDHIGDLSKGTFWYHSNDTKGTPGLFCVQIAQLMTHPAIYTLPFTLQLCYKLLGILQSVAKSQKVDISSHDELQKLHNINFAWHGSWGFLREKVQKLKFLPSPVTFFKKESETLSLKFDSWNTILNKEEGWSLASHTEPHCGYSCCNKNFQILLTSDIHWLAMMQMKIINILNIYLFFRKLIQIALSIISTVFLNKS